ncbi:MAG: GNAT family N-acetyltransferase [Blastocatellia bacterium]|jgi:GNAT superfamily N-acetyltransferase
MRQSESNEIFADLELARRLERTEACGGIEFVEARARATPESGARWIEVAGAAALYDGPSSPITQTFGLGMWQELTESDLDRIEAFYGECGATVCHEVSPLADVTTHQLLSRRGYHPVEMTSVMFRSLTGLEPESGRIEVRQAAEREYEEWARLAAEGWGEYADLSDLIYDLGLIMAKRRGSLSFLAALDGRLIATAGLCIAGDVALLTGASTIPRERRQGAQRALLQYRLRFAAECGCRLAMMCALPGSASQRNAERSGFRIAYTRIKWGLPAEVSQNIEQS